MLRPDRHRLPEAAWSPLALLGLFALAVLAHRGVVFEPRVCHAGDALRMSFSDRAFLVSELSAGRFPLWLPYEALGLPFFAQLSTGVLHPLNLLFALLPQGRAFAWQYVCASFLAAAGAWVVVRGRGGSRRAAFVAGAAFGLSGPILTQPNQTYLFGNASLPWALAALDLLRRQATPGTWLVAGLGPVLVLFAGDPQGVMVAYAFGLADALAEERGGRARAVLRLAGSGLVAALLASVQLLPAFEAFLASARAGLSLGEVERWSLAPARLLEFVSPGLDSLERAYHEGVLGQAEPPWSPSVFVGGAVLVLAAAGVLADRRSRALGILSALLTWAALGPAFGLSSLLARVVPLWSAFEYTEKLVPFLFLALALLAATGLDRLLAGWRGRSVTVGVAVVAAVPTAVVLTALAAGPSLGPAGRALAISAAIGLVPTLLLAAALTRRAPAQWVPIIAAAAVAVPDVWWSMSPALTVPEGVALGEPWAAGVLRAAQPGDVPPRIVPAIEPTLGDRTRASSRDSRAVLRPTYNVPARIDAVDEPYHPFVPAGFAELFAQGPLLPRIARIFGAGHLVLQGRHAAGSSWSAALASSQAAWEPFAAHPVSELDIEILRSRRALPRAFVAASATPAAGQGAAIAAVRAPDFAPARGIVVECATTPEDATPADRGTVEFVEWLPDRVVLQAALSTAGFVVLNDTWYAGWQATIDGVAAPICRANGYVRAVRVPPGAHRIAFEYAPASFTIGLASTAFAAAALLVLELRRRRARRAPM